jgi:hypothetical protein
MYELADIQSHQMKTRDQIYALTALTQGNKLSVPFQ